MVVGAGNRLESDDRFTYRSDDEGNLLEKTETATGIVTSYTYDHRNRLTGVEEHSAGGLLLSTTLYVYDARNRLIARVVNGQTLTTVYNGDETWADFDGSGNLVARYLNGRKIDSLEARWRPSDGLAWYLTDRLGTVRDMVNATGAIVLNHTEYGAFGQPLSYSNQAAVDRFLFTGREWEALATLYYYRARFYDPVSGRFISQDPLSFQGGDLNLYRYVSNAPTGAVDPFGMTASSEEWAFQSRNRVDPKDMGLCQIYINGLLAFENQTPLRECIYETRFMQVAAQLGAGFAGAAAQQGLIPGAPVPPVFIFRAYWNKIPLVFFDTNYKI